MRGRKYLLAAAFVITALSVPAAPGAAAVAAPGPGGGRASGHVRVSVFTGRDPAGLAAEAKAVSDPRSRDYGHYLTPAQVQARYGATAGQQQAVSRWLRRSGLTVTYRDVFTVSATGTAAQARSALGTRLGVTALAGVITTIRVVPVVAPLGQLPRLPGRGGRAGPGSRLAGPAARGPAPCSAYYGQKKATRLPGAYGRTLTWSPCGYTPQQVRSAYGAARAGLTGAGASVAVLSEATDPTAFGDTNRWSRAHGIPPFTPAQFTASVAAGVPGGTFLEPLEDAMDIEAVHGMAPAAHVSYVAGNGSITGDRLLDGLDAVVTHHLADVVTSSWFEKYMPVPASMIDAWEGVLQRAAVEGITMDTASGDSGSQEGLLYPGSDPWVTAVGGTSLAIGRHGTYRWEAGWEDHQVTLNYHRTAWFPAPPGPFIFGSTGGISRRFAEPFYQQGVVTGNVIGGKAMRAVPDVAALAEPAQGYQVGLTYPHYGWETIVGDGTSLASPLFAGFEADLIQGRHGLALGFANPALYDMAGTRAFHDITSDPQGQGFTEAMVTQPAPPTGPLYLETMGQCSAAMALACGPGYDTVTGLGSPGPAFFRSFGSRPR